MRKTTYIIGILVLILPVTAAAQMSDKAELQDIKSNFGGLNPVRRWFLTHNNSNLISLPFRFTRPIVIPQLTA